VTVTNGQITIQFSQGAADWRLVSAIAINPTGAVPPPPTPNAIPIARVNAGGMGYTDASGNAWSADWNYLGGNTALTSAHIAGTNSPTLYQTCRWGTFAYTFNIPNGNYTLKFAEIYFTSAGGRIFNVAPVLTNFDITAQVDAFTALDKSFPVAVTNGQISIQFSPGPADQPLVNAIEVQGQ
jgi:hypothetical protein